MRCVVVTILLMSAIWFTGCKSWKKVVEVPVYVHDTAYTVKELHDSTYIDRWHTIYQNGDTVRIRDSIVQYKYLIKTDTAYKYVEVPVTTTVTETVEVKKPLRWWEKALMWLGVAAIGVAAWRFSRFLSK